jgi:hypothetical protein
VTNVEFAKAVNAAFAEMGYAECVRPTPEGRRPAALFTSLALIPPNAVVWQASKVCAPELTPCWSCWLADGYVNAARSAACMAGECTTPDGPKKPPREALVAAR